MDTEGSISSGVGCSYCIYMPEVALIPCLVCDYSRSYLAMFLNSNASRSTDFEVHRNWLAITHSLPITKWYYDVRSLHLLVIYDSDTFAQTTSEWSQCRRILSLLEATNVLNSIGLSSIFCLFWEADVHSSLFPRSSNSRPQQPEVWRVVGDSLPANDCNFVRAGPWIRTTKVSNSTSLRHDLNQAATRFVRGTPNTSLFTQKIISASLFLHPGFIIVDHIHFQYNGFMYGLLLWSILMAREVSLWTYCHHPSSDLRLSEQ